jgi:hypothetical protein
VVPPADSDVWFYATIFNGVWTVIFTVLLTATTFLTPDDVALFVENAALFVIFGSLEVISTAFFSKE